MEAPRLYMTITHHGDPQYYSMERTTVKMKGDPDMDELLKAFTTCMVALGFHPTTIYRSMAEYALENEPDIGNAN